MNANWKWGYAVPVVLAFGMVMWPACVEAGAPSDTSMTYQGRLHQNGTAVNQASDFEFRLYDALNGGNLVGSAVLLSNVPVVDGLFTVELDFGASVFDGSARWLRIDVRTPAGGGSFTTLSPRQEMTRAPYALQTRGIFVNDSETFVGIGRQVPLTGAEYFGVATPATTTYGGMYISTAGESALPFYGYAAGGSADAWHFYDGATGNWQLYNNGIQLTVENDGDVGIGTVTPEAPLHVVEGVVANVTAHSNSSAAFERSGNNYVSIISPDANERGILFADAESNVNGGIIYNSGATLDGLQFRTGNNATRMAIDSIGRVGIGTAAPLFRLHVEAGNAVGIASFTSDTGVWGSTSSSSAGDYGVFGQHPSGSSYGVWSSGNFGASGTKSFRIDHPLDPGYKYLIHYCSESPEPLNVYSGTIALDEQGEAWVDLPAYFGHINRDLRYQLTCVGGYASVYVAEEVRDNRFKIAGGRRGLKVSWEVKGVRCDHWVNRNGAPSELDKPTHLQGLYLHPEHYGLSQEFAEHPIAQPDEQEPVQAEPGSSEDRSAAAGGTR